MIGIKDAKILNLCTYQVQAIKVLWNFIEKEFSAPIHLSLCIWAILRAFTFGAIWEDKYILETSNYHFV